MLDIFQKVLLYAALAGFAFLLPILVVKSKTTLLVQERLLSNWRSLSPLGRIVALSFLTIGILYGGSKTNSPPRLTMMRPTPSTKMSYAERKAQNWNIRGAWKDSFWLKFTDGWCFPYGTNHLRGVEVISFGELWQTPFDNNPVASLGVPIEIVPTLSSFLYEFTPSNSYRFAWENAAIGRDTNNLVSASLEFFRNGDILTVTNGIATYKERGLPDEWGDPSEDDFYGNNNTLPSGADEGAYYWVDLVVADAAAKVTFTGDKPSNYPDPEFIAKYNETNRVYLLIGKKYTATSDETITVVSKSSDNIIIDSISDNEIDIVLPVEFLVTNENEIDKTTSRAVTQVPIAGGFKIIPSPFLKGYYVWNTNEACCITHSNKVNDVWLFSCNKECNCTGCSFDGTFHYEGYYLDVLDVSCGCSFVEKPSATASISFSSGAVIFENCYTNAPNDIVPRRSTTNSLDITIYGGPFGGIAEIDFDDKGKLEYLMQEAIPHSVSVAAEQTLELSFPFTAKEESASENDIKASLKFTEYFTADTIESEDEMTAVRVEVVAEADWPENKNRHVFGPQEIFSMRTYPRDVKNSTWEIGDKLISSNQVSHIAHDEPTNLFAKVSYRGSFFGLNFSVIAPESLEAITCRAFADEDWLLQVGEVPVIGDVAVGMVADLRLLPDYVSFKNVFLQEGECEASNVDGFFVENAVALLPHGTAQGAFREVGVSAELNYAGRDFACASFGKIFVPLIEGAFEYSITNYWYVKQGDLSGERHPFNVTPQKFMIYPNGDFSISKFACTVVRGTNNLTTVSRRYEDD